MCNFIWGNSRLQQFQIYLATEKQWRCNPPKSFCTNNNSQILELYKNTHFSHLQKGWTPIGHTNTRPHLTSCKQVVSSFSEKLASNNFIFIRQPKTNYGVTHQTRFAQVIIDRLWNYITTQNCKWINHNHTHLPSLIHHLLLLPYVSKISNLLLE